MDESKDQAAIFGLPLLEYITAQEQDIESITERLCAMISRMGSDSDKISALNDVRKSLHQISPLKSEPIDLVQWVPVDSVKANDYNPNSVAPPEMELLRHSINHDGYTQPVVTWEFLGEREVVDGFHRTRVCREMEDVNKRVMGFLPVVSIKDDCSERNDRVASTIRHNRARGKHRVESMSDIVLELKKRNWTDKRIAKELGMDEDEILRLCQVSGLSDMFTDDGFSSSWDVGVFDESEVDLDVEMEKSGNSTRIYHTWDEWECFGYNFYGSCPPKGMDAKQCEEKYRELLSDTGLFRSALEGVLSEWTNSCEHYLSNENMNRIAWLGQAALAYSYRIPAIYRGGYNLLSQEEKELADGVALEFLNKWLRQNGREELGPESCASKTKANLY